MTETDPGPASLAALEARLRRDFELLGLPPAKDWLGPRYGRHSLDDIEDVSQFLAEQPAEQT